MATSIDLTNPLPVPTAADEFKEFTDLDLIANIQDPIRRVAAIMVALSQAEGDALTAETDEMKDDTEAIADTNELMRWVNDASSFLKTQNDGDKWPMTSKTMAQADAQHIRDRLVAAGVDPLSITVVQLPWADGYNFQPTSPSPNDYAVLMTKAQYENAGKNLQTHVDELSNNSQEKQIYMQNLTSKLNAALEWATNSLRGRGTVTDAILQNVRK
jgi:hypothetical protein